MKIRMIASGLLVGAISMFSVNSQAALVELSFSGDATNSDGEFTYLPGETFSGRFVFDTTLASDGSFDPNVGVFSDNDNFSSDGSGIVFFELITTQGTISFERNGLSGSSFSRIVSTLQVQGPNTQNITVTIQSFFEPIISGNIAGFIPSGVAFQGISIGTGDTFFNDANNILSGAGTLSLSEFDSALISMNFVGGAEARFALTSSDTLNIRELSAIPVPAAVWLFSSAIVCLLFGARSKHANQATA